MTKKRLTIYFTFGIVAGLFLTACAGVATGNIKLPGVGQVSSFGPNVQVAPAPAIELDQPGPTDQLLDADRFSAPQLDIQNEAVEMPIMEQPEDQAHFQIRTHRAMELHGQVQSQVRVQTEVLFQSGHHCNRP